MQKLISKIVCLILAGVFICPISKAQSGFFVSFDVSSENMIIPLAVGTVVTSARMIQNWDSDDVGIALLGFIPNSIGNAVSLSGFRPHYYLFRENGQKIKRTERWRDFFGIKPENLFGNLKASVKFGWMGAYSPVGIYANLGYRHQNFAMQLASESSSSRYRFGTFCPGIGLRLSPANLFDLDWSIDADQGTLRVLPIIDFGTIYNKKIQYKGPYDGFVNETVINDGLSYNVAMGVSFGKRMSILLGAEWFPYDLFNRDFSSGTVKPFENLTSKQLDLYIRGEIGF